MSSTRRSRLPAPSRCSPRAIGDERRRASVGAGRTAKRRRRRAPRRDPVGVAHVPPRVAAAAPGRDAPHRRRRGRDRQHHARLQHELRGQRRVRLGQHRARVRRHRSAEARGRTRLRQEMVRNDRRHRPPLGRRPRQRRQGGLPGAGSATAPTAASSSRSARAATRRAAGEVAVTDGVARLLRLELGSTAGARRSSADRRRHRRESAQAQRRVRSRLALVRERAGPRHGSGRRERRVARILPGLPGRGSLRLRRD